MKKLLLISLLLPSLLSASSQERKNHVRSASLDSSEQQKSALAQFYSQSLKKTYPQNNTEQKNNDGSFTERDLKEARNFLDKYYAKNGGMDAVLKQIQEKQTGRYQ